MSEKVSEKIKAAAEHAKQAAGDHKGQLEEAARKAQASAEEHAGEIRERVTEASHRGGKRN